MNITCKNFKFFHSKFLILETLISLAIKIKEETTCLIQTSVGCLLKNHTAKIQPNFFGPTPELSVCCNGNGLIIRHFEISSRSISCKKISCFIVVPYIQHCSFFKLLIHFQDYSDCCSTQTLLHHHIICCPKIRKHRNVTIFSE